MCIGSEVCHHCLLAWKQHERCLCAAEKQAKIMMQFFFFWCWSSTCISIRRDGQCGRAGLSPENASFKRAEPQWDRRCSTSNNKKAKLHLFIYFLKIIKPQTVGQQGWNETLPIGAMSTAHVKVKDKMVGVSDRRGQQMAVDRGAKKTERGTQQRQMQPHICCVPTPST